MKMQFQIERKKKKKQIKRFVEWNTTCVYGIDCDEFYYSPEYFWKQIDLDPKICKQIRASKGWRVCVCVFAQRVCVCFFSIEIDDSIANTSLSKSMQYCTRNESKIVMMRVHIEQSPLHIYRIYYWANLSFVIWIFLQRSMLKCQVLYMLIFCATTSTIRDFNKMWHTVSRGYTASTLYTAQSNTSLL